jgi:hypothetical protein
MRQKGIPERLQRNVSRAVNAVKDIARSEVTNLSPGIHASLSLREGVGKRLIAVIPAKAGIPKRLMLRDSRSRRE